MSSAAASIEGSLVDVLLATFQGERYLPAFLDSLARQAHANWRLHVRDDGSTDRTAEIIADAARRDPRIRIATSGAHLGPVRGYSALLEAASAAQYTAFADQDDVWLENKLQILVDRMRSVEAAAGAGTPCLVHSDLEVTDENLNPLSQSFWAYRKLDPEKSSFARLTAQNIVTGCALLINRAARTGVGRIPDEAMMHDWWIAMYVAATGVVAYVPRPLVRYRQHGSNAIGAEEYHLRAILKAASNPARLRERIASTRIQARAFAEAYGSVLPARVQRIAREYGAAATRAPLRRRMDIVRLGTWKHGLIRNIALILYA